jgi:hypothetical protein
MLQAISPRLTIIQWLIDLSSCNCLNFDYANWGNSVINVFSQQITIYTACMIFHWNQWCGASSLLCFSCSYCRRNFDVVRLLSCYAVLYFKILYIFLALLQNPSVPQAKTCVWRKIPSSTYCAVDRLEKTVINIDRVARSMRVTEFSVPRMFRACDTLCFFNSAWI